MSPGEEEAHRRRPYGHSAPPVGALTDLINFGHGAETRHFAGSRDSLQRTGKLFHKRQSLEPFPKEAGMEFTIGSKR